MLTNEYQPERRGFQVLLSVHNGENYMQACLESLDQSLKHHDWVLLYGDDASTDDTTIELAKYARALTCDKVHLYEYDKASTVGEAKNRLVKEAHSFKKQYPYILFMDVDDKMHPERAAMAETAIEKDSQYVVGSWERIGTDGAKQKTYSLMGIDQLLYGPWATLFHCDFLPEDGHFFPEDEVSDIGHEDILTWAHLKYIEDKKPTPHLSFDPVHTYIVREFSVSNPSDPKKTEWNNNVFWGILNQIKNNKRNIYKNPLSLEEAEEAMNEYVASQGSKTTPHFLH
jgi:glycosyltransferase involved in cell wall biosynthesis